MLFCKLKINELHKKITKTTGSGRTLTNKEIKIIKVIKSLEKSGILLKGTSRKIKSREGGFLGSVLGPLMKVDLPLM